MKPFAVAIALFTVVLAAFVSMTLAGRLKRWESIAHLSPATFLGKSIADCEKVVGAPGFTTGAGSENRSDAYGRFWQVRYYRAPGLTRFALVRVAEKTDGTALSSQADALEYQFPQERVRSWQEALQQVGISTEGVQEQADPAGGARLSAIPGGYSAGWVPVKPGSGRSSAGQGSTRSHLLLLYPSEGRYSKAAASAVLPSASRPVVSKRIRPSDLPRPYHTSSIDANPEYIRGQGDPPLQAPEGFVVEPFARKFFSPRWMTVASNGDIFVTESYQGRVLLLRDGDGDGRAEERYTFATGLRLPHGLAIQDGWLYVGNTDAVVRFAYEVGQTEATGPPEVIVSGLPALGRKQHWTRNLVFEPDGKHFLLTVGSASNKGVESPPRATITRYRADGSGRETLVTGIRNPVGIGFRPGTQEIWTTCVERDFMGDDLVPDFFTQVRKGDFFGWPWYYIGNRRDPRAPRGAPNRKVRVPDVLFTSHSVPLGMVFYTGSNFPARYQGDVFVAMRGSTNRRLSSGYRVVRVPFRNGRPTGSYEDFLTGWLSDPRTHLVYGRPVGIVQWTDGSLLVSDEAGHMLWRVRYVDPLKQLR